MAWPEEVPVLTQRDMHKGAVNGPNGTHCLVGWAVATFGYCHNRELDKVYTAIRRVAGVGVNEVSHFNDSHRKVESAKVWNKAMANLGYVVGNPEAPRSEK